MQMKEEFLVQPMPYKVRFVPRSGEHEKVVRREWKERGVELGGWE